MKYSEKSIHKRTQRDYNLGFKLAVVDQVEKGDMELPSEKSVLPLNSMHPTRKASESLTLLSIVWDL